MWTSYFCMTRQKFSDNGCIKTCVICSVPDRFFNPGLPRVNSYKGGTYFYLNEIKGNNALCLLRVFPLGISKCLPCPYAYIHFY